MRDQRLVDAILDDPQIIGRLAATIDDSACPECGWPVEVRWNGVTCVHCRWWWTW